MAVISRRSFQNIELLLVDSNPNGVSAPVGSLATLKTNNQVINPLYVSVGHKISLESAKSIVLACCTYKNPEPIRNSDIKSKLYL